jgi:hypothetical protein
MAQGDSVPTPIGTLITGANSRASTNRRSRNRRYPVSNVWALYYATAVILLGWLPWNVLLILLLFLRTSSKRGSSA